LKRADPKAPAGVCFSPDGGGALAAHIDEILGERADDAVAPGVDLADVLRVPQGGLDDAAGGGVDDGRYAARLGIEGILLNGFFHSAKNSAAGAPAAPSGGWFDRAGRRR
jgi:hypothetical protein